MHLYINKIIKYYLCVLYLFYVAIYFVEDHIFIALLVCFSFSVAPAQAFFCR